MKWNNSITVSVYHVYKISIGFSLLNAGIDFPTPPTPSPTTSIALATVNKLQENYFSTVSQCLPYLTATAVTRPNAPVWDVYGWKYYCLWTFFSGWSTLSYYFVSLIHCFSLASVWFSCLVISPTCQNRHSSVSSRLFLCLLIVFIQKTN